MSAKHIFGEPLNVKKGRRLCQLFSLGIRINIAKRASSWSRKLTDEAKIDAVLEQVGQQLYYGERVRLIGSRLESATTHQILSNLAVRFVVRDPGAVWPKVNPIA